MSSNVSKIEKPPALPPKKIAPDPDYEVIEFSNEQYSNAQPIKSTNGRVLDALKCELCGSMSAKVKCDQCNQQLFCSSCDDMFHRHPKRNTHIRKAIVIQTDIKPPLPPKGEHLLPVPPPRRKKTGMTPLLPRKEMPFMQRPQAPPSPALSLRERVSSIKRFIVPGSKNSAENQQKKDASFAMPPRPETPNSDTSSKLPSLAMERIKIHTNNARDRMEIMQKRYHDYQESIKSDNRNRSPMNASPNEPINTDLRSSSNRSDSFGMRLRSGSLSNFTNKFNNNNNNGRFDQNPNDFDETIQDDGSISDSRSRAFSSSVHDLSFGRNNMNNQWPHAQQPFAAPFGYMPNPYHNHMQPNACMNCSQQQLWNPQMMEPQWNAKNLNGSNMSLNLPPSGYYPPPPFNMAGTNGWVNNGSYQKPDYSYHFGMMPYNNGYPHPMSRPHSRVPSRAASPALSSKSRKSTISNRHMGYRNSYIDQQLTDDESSDSIGYIDDLNHHDSRRSSIEHSIRNSRHRMQDSPQRSYDEDNEIFSRRSFRHNSRGRRASSGARSLSSRSERRPSQGIRSDSTQDSETELGTRALVQAKIREKVAQASSNDSSTDLSKSKSMPQTRNLKKPTTTPSTVNKIENLNAKQPEKKSVTRPVQKVSSTVQTDVPKPKEPSPKKPESETVDETKSSPAKDNEQDLNDIADTAPSGPPPSTPDYEWECEFCTFTNEPKTKICAICCKTPTTQAVRKQCDEQPKPPINGRVDDRARDISKEGFWLVSTSEDDLSEIQSYESDPPNGQWEAEKSENDFEVMNILSSQIADALDAATESVDVKPENVTESSVSQTENHVEESRSPVHFVNQNDHSETHLNNIAEKTQNDEKNVQKIVENEEIVSVKQQISDHFTHNTETRPNHSNNLNENRNKSFDADLLAYIDQSLKSLIGAVPSTSNQNTVPAYPFLHPSQMYANNAHLSMKTQQMIANGGNRTTNDTQLFKVLLGANNYSYDEIQIALANCPEADPITWLNDNWQKLIETVQTLATKYGQEHKENIVGTISSVEAREALKKHKGNVWHAVTECIENRQSAFNTIKSKGNYSSEDIVTYLTAHNGNLEKALEELNRVQMKPFLMKILNFPAAVNSEMLQVVAQTESALPQNETQSEIKTVESVENKQPIEFEPPKNDEKNLLKDIEAIIGSMEEKQSKQTEALLQTIENLVGNLNVSQVSRPMSSASNFSMASLDRIDMKSPIVVPSKSNNINETNSDVENDVKDFVSRHIQDIVPDVAALVNRELIDKTINEVKLNSQNDEKQIVNGEIDSVNELLHQQTPIEKLIAAEPIKIENTEAIENASSAIVETEILQQSENPSNFDQQKTERTPQSSRIKYNVNSLYPRMSRSQAEKLRIRKLERQLLKQKKRQILSSMNEKRSDSQNTGYLSDATITPDIIDELPPADHLPDESVSNEKTFSLSIVEQAMVDNNKEFLEPANEPDVVSITSDRDTKSRNLSELVQDTKNLIQQMKFEINEDIAMSASEFEFDDDDGATYLDEEFVNSDYSDSWEDIDNESNFSGEEIYSDDEIIEVEPHDEYNESRSQTGESEYFSEANEQEDIQHLIDQHDESTDEVMIEVNIQNENLILNEIVNEEGTTSEESEPRLQVIEEEPSSIEKSVEAEAPAEKTVEAEPPIEQSAVAEPSVEKGELPTEKSVEVEIPTENNLEAKEPIEKSVETEPSLTTKLAEITEHMFEIQQSLQSTSIVALSIRDMPNTNREKSTSTEPSVTPLPPKDEELPISPIMDTEIEHPTIESNGKEIILDDRTSLTQLNLETAIEENTTEPQIVDQSDSQIINDRPNIAENVIEASASNSSLDNESDVISEKQEINEPMENSDPENIFEEQQPSQEISEEQANANDTGSEIDEISADVSHASVSTTDESSRDTNSSVSLAPSETLVESYKYNKITVPVLTQCKESMINVMQLKTNTTNKSTTVKNKIPVRRPSFSEPSASIRNIQNELMNKAQLRQPPQKFSKKPSKIVPPKLFFKSMFHSNEENKPATTAGPKKAELTDNNIPSTSSGYHQKIPKKKYFETCFSDDYQTSDDESRPVFMNTKVIPNLVQVVESNIEESFDVDIMAKQLLQDGKVKLYTEALLAANLMQKKFKEDKAIWAATQTTTIEDAISLLHQECELCMEFYPINRIVSMLKCTHSCCEECAKNYFTIQITDRSITDCSCPFCKLPDLNAAETTEDDALEYFSNMDILLKSILDESTHELFQRKLRDRTLMQDPNFKWCVQCSSGFFARPRQKKLICPDCGSITCSQCRKTWESQHEGISCDQFTEWKELNDPDKQAQGVAHHLQLHGISCPKCKFKYSLARGGCMHFTCTQCKYEFCYGCNKPFKMGAKCKVSDYCAKLGLHSHHPRNCLFYLRDKDPIDLQTLLQMHNVPFNTEPLDFGLSNPSNGQNSDEDTHRKKLCPMPIQKEIPTGLIDTVCNGDIEQNSAGLCRAHFVEYLCFLIRENQIDTLRILSTSDLETVLRRANRRLPVRPYAFRQDNSKMNSIFHCEMIKVHYISIAHFVEYLVSIVAKANIDPLPILDLTDCVQELRRSGIALPERGPWDTDPIYRDMCSKIVEKHIPLD